MKIKKPYCWATIKKDRYSAFSILAPLDATACPHKEAFTYVRPKKFNHFV